MRHSTLSPLFQATDDFEDFTAHGLLVAAHRSASDFGFFSSIPPFLSLSMKKIDYSWVDKLSTLWASLVVGCDHTVEINSTLGPQERAAAALFGLERFPDQSQCNRLLHAFCPEHIPQFRRLHLHLLVEHSRARKRRLWARLANTQPVLFLDLDQRGLSVSSTRFELAAKGYFGRKRSRFGYQLSLAFFGGQVGEVLDEYLDPGNTPAAARVEDLLEAAAEFCRRTAIAPHHLVVRGDAQYGTAEIIEKISARGFHYLLKGKSSQRARRLLERVPDEALFHLVENGANRDPAWMVDLGPLDLTTKRTPSDASTLPPRRLFVDPPFFAPTPRPPAPKARPRRKADGTDRKRVRKVDALLTDLEPHLLPIDRVLET